MEKYPNATKTIADIVLADSVQEVQPLAHLARHALDDANRDAVVVVALDHGQQIASQHLKHHAHVAAVRAHVVEAVHELDGTAVGVQLSPAHSRKSTQRKSKNGKSMATTSERIDGSLSPEVAVV